MADIASVDKQSRERDLQRRAERCRDHGTPFVILQDRLFSRSGHVVTPEGSEGVALTHGERRRLLKQLGGLVLQWTDGLDDGCDIGPWYHVVCRVFEPMESMSAKKRSQIRRGLRNCDVRLISVEELAENGYHVYRSATEGYAQKQKIVTEEAFRRDVLREGPYPDLLDNWGVYADGRMIAYAQNQLYGTQEVCYSSIKLDPDCLKLYPSHALIYTMTEHYLNERGFSLVNDGARSLVHETNIQDFLIRNLGFERAYTRVHVHYRWYLALIVRLVYPFGSRASRANGQLAALLELERCRRLSQKSTGNRR